MNPGRRLLDRKEGGEYPFHYVPSCSTNVRERTMSENAASINEAQRLLTNAVLLMNAYPEGSEIHASLARAVAELSAALLKIKSYSKNREKA